MPLFTCSTCVCVCVCVCVSEGGFVLLCRIPICDMPTTAENELLRCSLRVSPFHDLQKEQKRQLGARSSRRPDGTAAKLLSAKATGCLCFCLSSWSGDASSNC